MKLYFAPGACSLSPHIVLHEAGLAHEVVKVDLQAKKTADGADYAAINPKGYVPALALDDGRLLTEGPAIVQYLADQVPDKQLAPPSGSFERYQVQEWLNFISSELHKTAGALFNPALTPEIKQMFRSRALGRFTWVDQQLAGKSYLMGERFTVPDAYLFVVSNWTPKLEIDISGLKNLAAFRERMMARPSVQAAMKMEGLIR